MTANAALCKWGHTVKKKKKKKLIELTAREDSKEGLHGKTAARRLKSTRESNRFMKTLVAHAGDVKNENSRNHLFQLSRATLCWGGGALPARTAAGRRWLHKVWPLWRAQRTCGDRLRAAAKTLCKERPRTTTLPHAAQGRVTDPVLHRTGVGTERRQNETG